MSLTSAYLITTKNLEAFLNAIVSAKAPEVFTNKFLDQLEFKSTNDRLFIGVLKGLGFLDDTSKPTPRYYKYLDQSLSRSVLAEAIKEAYGDLFQVNIKANELSVEAAKNKFRSLTQGQKSPKVLGLMANTFTALCSLAEWSTNGNSKPATLIEPEIELPETKDETDKLSEISVPTQLHYNIQIHLPESRDPAVFDAIFRSLKQHLL